MPTVAILSLKSIAPARNGGPERKPWVAQLIGLDERRSYARTFVDAKTDYSGADKRGRGLKLSFTLESGRLYEINEWRSRFREERYFVRVDETGEVRGVRRADVIRILQEAQCARDERIRQSLDALDRSEETSPSTS